MSSNISPRNQTSHDDNPEAERVFCEFRRKVRNSEVLSAAIEKLLRSLKYTGDLTVVVQNGEVLKSGYEEAYFHHRSGFTV